MCDFEDTFSTISLGFGEYMKIPVIALGFLFMGSAIASEPLSSRPLGEQQAAFTIKMFLDLCVSTRGEKQWVKAQAERLGFRPLIADAANRFTGSSGGQAWSVKITGGIWALALAENGVCTVYAQKVDAVALQREVAFWVPPPSSGFETEAEPATTSASGLRTMAYQIRRGKQSFAAWVLSTSTMDDAFFQGAISLKMAPIVQSINPPDAAR
jgi:hypothetical protein